MKKYQYWSVFQTNMCVLLHDHTEYKPPSISGRLVLKYDIITMVYTMVIVAAVITSPFIKSAGNISVSIHIFDKISSVDKNWKPDSAQIFLCMISKSHKSIVLNQIFVESGGGKL